MKTKLSNLVATILIAPAMWWCNTFKVTGTSERIGVWVWYILGLIALVSVVAVYGAIAIWG